MTPTHIKLSRYLQHPTIFYAELSAGELIRNYVIAAETWADAQMRALEYCAEDERKARESGAQPNG
jgi:hypothetical protein